MAPASAGAALPTVYHGTEFRSRLEARWAIFMDRAGVRWSYEPEGYALPSGYYLPDFHLPDIRKFLEVKPDGLPSDQIIRAEQLAHELASATGTACVIAWGFPDPTKVEFQGPRPGVASDHAGGKMTLCDEGWDHNYAFTVCPECGKVGIEFDARGGRVCGHGFEKEYNGGHPLLVDAYQVAWSARYDHETQTLVPGR